MCVNAHTDSWVFEHVDPPVPFSIVRNMRIEGKEELVERVERVKIVVTGELP